LQGTLENVISFMTVRTVLQSVRTKPQILNQNVCKSHRPNNFHQNQTKNVDGEKSV
jgi:hypothetical protein